MKSVSEFPSFLLSKAVTAKATLVAEGKTPEEIEQNLGATFKYENEKLKYFLASIDVAAQNAQNLRRVLVISLNENETAPSKAVKVDEHYYLPEFMVMAAPVQEATDRKGGRRGGPGGKGKPKGPKESPWGLSPEEKAAKNKSQTAKA